MMASDQSSHSKARAFFHALPSRFVGPVAVLAFLLIALIRWDILTAVTYQRAEVFGVVPATGKNMIDRVVFVRIGDWQRGLYTSDPYLNVVVGGQACVAVRRMLLRRWLRYAVVLPGYCRSLIPLSHSVPSYPQASGEGYPAIAPPVPRIDDSGPALR